MGSLPYTIYYDRQGRRTKSFRSIDLPKPEATLGDVADRILRGLYNIEERIDDIHHIEFQWQGVKVRISS